MKNDYLVTWLYMTHTVEAKNLREAIDKAVVIYGDSNNIVECKLLKQ
jgi:hypothetical protein